MGRSARSIGPSRAAMSRKCVAVAAVAGEEDAAGRRPRSMNPPHSARLRSNGLRAEKCCAGVTVTGERRAAPAATSRAPRPGECRPNERAAPLPSGVTTTGIEAPRQPRGASQIAVIVVIVAEERRARSAADRRMRTPAARTRPGPRMRRAGARSEYIGSVRTFPLRVWIRNVEWPMKVTTARSAVRGSGGRCGCDRDVGGPAGPRLAAAGAARARTAGPLAPLGLKKRRPSK